MQQMQDPEGRSYQAGNVESARYPNYQESEQADWASPQHENQQRLRTESNAKLSTTNYVMAIWSMVASSLIMGLSIALVALTANMFGRTIWAGITDALPYYIFNIIIASFVVSLILLFVSIAGFVFSTIQLSMIVKKLKHLRGTVK